MRGVPGDYFDLRASFDVGALPATWPVLATVRNQWGAVPFLDAQALTNKMRYYRTERSGP